MRRFLLIILVLLGFVPCWGIDTGQKIFRDNVKTLSVYSPDDFMAPPIIGLKDNRRLNINFDIIGETHEYLRFRLIHCNADWQPSRLMESEYLGSFNEFEITDYAYSANTYVHYVNYNISLPDADISFLASGNYLLQVYPENDPGDVILQARFSVSENLVYIQGGQTTRTDRGVNTDFQQLFFQVDTKGFGSLNPYQDVVVTVMQNNRPETMRSISHPLRVENGRLIFEHTPQLIYEAGNEYRRFETVKADYAGMHIEDVNFENGLWNAWLQKDSSRKHSAYAFDSTQHGRFKVDEYNSTDPDLSADYVLVHFTLDPGESPRGKIYVDGDFTNHEFKDYNQMKYDWNDGLYHTSIPLKQGSYNYQYVEVSDKGEVSAGTIEGNKYETGNEYLIQVFLRLPGSRGDRLIGSQVL